MLGFIVKHEDLGFGKVVNLDAGSFRVEFLVTKQQHHYGLDAFADGDLARAYFPIGTSCRKGNQKCSVTEVVAPPRDMEPVVYEVKDDEGRLLRVSEVDLRPEDASNLHLPELPLDMLLQVFPDEFKMFRARDGLLESFSRLVHKAGGIRSLLASRVDLRRHQAFVAGSVLLDRRQRYLLADEVGLGKTIEAGIVLCDLIARQPDARILILCPSTLTQQWLAELYSKFGLTYQSHGFSLLDLHDTAKFDFDALRKGIASFRLAAYECPEQLTAVPWDMVIVDEVHQVLATKRQYEFVHHLACTTKSLLLLSAMPAQHRETELLKLLALLEPHQFHPHPGENRTDFMELYKAQNDIGKRISMLQECIACVKGPEEKNEFGYTAADVVTRAKKLAQTSVVAQDQAVQQQLVALATESPTLLADATTLLYDVADRYRLHRRILRNRRQKLIDTEQIVPIQRKCERVFYCCSQIELEAQQAVDALLQEAYATNADLAVLLPMARVLWHALASPTCILKVLRCLNQASARELSEEEKEFVSLGMPGHSEWRSYLDALCTAARPYISQSRLDVAMKHIRWWADRSDANRRAEEFCELLESKHDAPSKHVVFAGFPGLAEELTEHLQKRFGQHAVTSFRADMSQDQKEAQVRSFRRPGGPWILVCDETGGEGRNFQFATELFHYDTPWNAASVEQRIGRLDRLGREKYAKTVVSNVYFCKGGVEHGLVTCFHEGLKVYVQSISGLELALRDVERQLTTVALKEGYAGLVASEHLCDMGKRVQRERTLDAGEAVLDAAMHLEQRNLDLEGVGNSADAESRLENGVIGYIRNLTGQLVDRVRDDDFPDAVWQFSPSDLTRLAVPSAGNGHVVPDIRGTFRRSVAQQRPELTFFTVGNRFLDELLTAVESRRPGRAYAVECRAVGDPWVGFEFIYRVEVDTAALESWPGLANQAARVIRRRHRSIFIDVGGNLADATKADILLKVRHGLKYPGRGTEWWDLDVRHVGALQAVADGNWRKRVNAAYDAATAHAKAAFGESLSRHIAAEHRRIDELVRQAQREEGPGAADELAGLQALRQVVADWRPVLDSAGFLSVNGDLRMLP